MPTAKEQVRDLLQHLPDDCSLEDVQHQLYVIQKVQRSLDDVDRNGGISNEEAAQRLQKWLAK